MNLSEFLLLLDASIWIEQLVQLLDPFPELDQHDQAFTNCFWGHFPSVNWWIILLNSSWPDFCLPAFYPLVKLLIQVPSKCPVSTTGLTGFQADTSQSTTPTVNLPNTQWPDLFSQNNFNTSSLQKNLIQLRGRPLMTWGEVGGNWEKNSCGPSCNIAVAKGGEFSEAVPGISPKSSSPPPPDY